VCRPRRQGFQVFGGAGLDVRVFRFWGLRGAHRLALVCALPGLADTCFGLGWAIGPIIAAPLYAVGGFALPFLVTGGATLGAHPSGRWLVRPSPPALHPVCLFPLSAILAAIPSVSRVCPAVCSIYLPFHPLVVSVQLFVLSICHSIR
jgi:hypothetical protein